MYKRIRLDLPRQTLGMLNSISMGECRNMEQMVTYIVKQYIATWEHDRDERRWREQLEEIQQQVAVSNAGAAAPGSGGRDGLA